MTKPVTHFSNVRHFGGRTYTSTLCNRMVGDGDINCSEAQSDVTCKICLKQLEYRNRKAA